MKGVARLLVQEGWYLPRWRLSVVRGKEGYLVHDKVKVAPLLRVCQRLRLLDATGQAIYPSLIEPQTLEIDGDNQLYSGFEAHKTFDRYLFHMQIWEVRITDGYANYQSS